jgi:hypothetical protein
VTHCILAYNHRTRDKPLDMTVTHWVTSKTVKFFISWTGIILRRKVEESASDKTAGTIAR